jgi:hypothetical protein
MIVTVRRWTSIALPRLARRGKTARLESPSKSQNQEKRQGFLDTYNKMFEHQVSLMFKDDLDM